MAPSIPSTFSTDVPSNQAAVDIFKDLWKSAFPVASGLKAGTVPNFEDARVPWADRVLGGLRGRSILELGPFEAYNTFQFSQLGAAPITAVEGNSTNYLKCLVVKETLGINASFLHGDIRLFLEQTEQRFDICWASGVLYHQVEPLALLSAIARVCPRVFIWTHFFDDRISSNPESYPNFDPKRDVEKGLGGFRCMHYCRSYLFRKGQRPASFSGGYDNFAYWLRKDDILGFLDQLGFANVTIRGVSMEHPAGPTISLLASKPGAT